MIVWMLACSTPVEPPTQPRPAPAVAPVPTPPPPSAPAIQALGPSKGTPLEALLPTSGDAPVMDGDPKTMWKPYGDPKDEGILFRLERPRAFESIALTSCGTEDAEFTLYADGAQIEQEPSTMKGGMDVVSTWSLPAGPKKSVFLRALHWPEGACLGEVTFPGTDFVAPRRVRAAVQATSTLEPSLAYHPSYIADGRVDFGWVEGADGMGLGESIQFKLATPVAVKGMVLWNGYQRSDAHFKKNGKATKVAVHIGNERFELDVAPRMGRQRLEFPKTLTTTQIGIQILEAGPKTQYDDVVLSEVLFFDEHGSVPLMVNDKQRAFGTLTQVRTTAMSGFVDRTLTALCEHPNTPSKGTLRFRSNNSFAFYEEQGGDATVLEGAWVMTDPAANRVKLYARLTEVVNQWEPYGETSTSVRREIAGDTLALTRADQLNDATWASKTEGLCGSHNDAKAKGALWIEGKRIRGVFHKN